MDKDMARRAAETALEPGETLIWSGSPGNLASIVAAKASTIAFMVMWTLFALAWTGLSVWSVYVEEPRETELVRQGWSCCCRRVGRLTAICEEKCCSAGRRRRGRGGR